MEKLPKDLKMEILLHLPVKYLLRCKCLSKSWFSLISNPIFTKLHFQRSSQHTHRFLHTTPSQIWSIDINPYSFHYDSATLKLVFPLLKPNTRVEIISSCRGFILLMLVQEQLLLLWNPTTNHQKQIPKPSSSLPWLYISTTPYFFWYDEPTDDYLVLAYNPSSGLRNPEILIFSLRTNSWQKLADLINHQLPKLIRMPFLNGSFLNGAIHWLSSSQPTKLFVAKIIAFDVTTKHMREIPTPPEDDEDEEEEDDDDNSINYYLGVVGGCLTLTSNNYRIWVMREYGVKSSWTKFISSSRRHRVGISGYIFPLCSNKDGEILAIDCGGVGGLSKRSDNNNNGEILEYLEDCRRRRRPRKPGWVVYTETLLSLPLTD